MGRPVTEKDLAWFMAHGKRAMNGCLEWQGKVGKRGYGVTSRYRKEVLVHRWVYWLLTGESPEAVLHLCDNRTCFEPSHLRGGTRAENNKDAALKGRMPGRPTITREQALAIRQRRLAGERGCDLAREYGVSASTICDISKGRSWAKHPDNQVPF